LAIGEVEEPSVDKRRKLKRPEVWREKSGRI
jgi:hypothetical protein